MLRAVCPGCGQEAVVLPPRVSARRPARGWRRKAHYIGTVRRCRYPVVDLTDEEVAACVGVVGEEMRL